MSKDEEIEIASDLLNIPEEKENHSKLTKTDIELLRGFIKESIDAGKTRKEIKDNLSEEMWDERIIEETLSEFKQYKPRKEDRHMILRLFILFMKVLFALSIIAVIGGAYYYFFFVNPISLFEQKVEKPWIPPENSDVMNIPVSINQLKYLVTVLEGHRLTKLPSEEMPEIELFLEGNQTSDVFTLIFEDFDIKIIRQESENEDIRISGSREVFYNVIRQDGPEQLISVYWENGKITIEEKKTKDILALKGYYALFESLKNS